MPWRPDRNATLLAVACLTLLIWVALSLLGQHPDGAILGFSGTMWMLWGTTERGGKRRDRRDRDRDKGDESDDEEP